MWRPTYHHVIRMTLVTLALVFVVSHLRQSGQLFKYRFAELLPSQQRSSSGDPLGENQRFWRDFHEILKRSKPDCPSPVRLGKHAPSIGFDPSDISNVTMQEYIMVDPEVQGILKTAHSTFMQLASGTTAPKVYSKHGSRGIVSTAGGPLLPAFLLTLYMLRKSGSELPVEIFLADQTEYDSFVCERMMPEMNSKCIVLSDILDISPPKEGLKKYQFKIFSLLFTSFEQVIFVDADDFPLHDPSFLFDSEPFISAGLITWPDFWKVSYHRSFFEIASQAVPDSFPYASTESGQIVLDKRKHHKTLLLSAYYNFYGPSHYYPLLSQGAPGEGDKETFVVASKRLNLPSYQVKAGPGVLGRFSQGKFQGSGILQADPAWDFQTPNNTYYGWKGGAATPNSSFLFLHVNLPKLNPQNLFGSGRYALDAEGNPRRIWSADTSKKLGSDIERVVWDGLRSITCMLENEDRRIWEGGLQYCRKIEQYQRELFGDS